MTPHGDAGAREPATAPSAGRRGALIVVGAGLVIGLIAGGAGMCIDRAAAAPGDAAGSANRGAAPSQAEIAAKLNKEGVALMSAGKYAEASGKFRAAVARVPEPGYFLNLCSSLFQAGKFGEALTACNAVAKNNPTADQRAKAQKLAARIREEAKAQGIAVEPAAPAPPAADPPKGPSQAEIAAALHTEGKALLLSGKASEAASKFRQAVARVPDPTYFFSLCVALFQDGKLGESLTACTAAAAQRPPADLRAKIDRVIGQIRDQAKAQGVPLTPP